MDLIEKEFGRRWPWHDLRAAFITHVAITSGALAAQTLARHSDFDTTRAYIEVANEVMRQAADRAVERPCFESWGAEDVVDASPWQALCPRLQNLTKLLILMVGAAGFEPTTPSPPDWCANQAAPRSDTKI
jgi:hypothetical protein